MATTPEELQRRARVVFNLAEEILDLVSSGTPAEEILDRVDELQLETRQLEQRLEENPS